MKNQWKINLINLSIEYVVQGSRNRWRGAPFNQRPSCQSANQLHLSHFVWNCPISGLLNRTTPFILLTTAGVRTSRDHQLILKVSSTAQLLKRLLIFWHIVCYSIDSTMAPRYMDYDDFGNYSNFFHWSNNFIVIFSFKLWKLFNCFTIELTICLLIFHRNWTARRHDYPFSRWRRGSFSGRHWETDRVGGGSAAVPAASSGFGSWWCTTWRTGAGGRRWVIECDTWFQLFQ